MLLFWHWSDDSLIRENCSSTNLNISLPFSAKTNKSLFLENGKYYFHCV